MSGQKVPKGYKQTEVGVIPEDWDVESLSSLTEIRSGIAKNANVSLSNPVLVHYLRVANVQDGFLDLSEMSQLQLNREDIKRYAVLPGDMLMNEGGDLDKLGRGTLWNGEYSPCVHQNHVFVVRCRSQLIPSYLNFWTQTTPSRQYFMLAGRQTTNLASINKTSLGQLPVVLPPTIAEQKQIARALSDIDALIEGLEGTIGKKRQIKQGAMQELLMGKRRLPGFGNQWESKQFGELVAPRSERIDPRKSGGHNFCIELEHIGSGTDLLLSSTTTGNQSSLKSVFYQGDVLFGKLRAYLRKYWQADCSGVCSTEIWVLSPKDKLILSAYLFQVIQTDQFIETATLSYGTHMPRSDWSVVKNYELLLPPTIEEQTAIATILSDMDSAIATLEAKLTKTRQLKQGMMHELLTGRIRLV